ncbi:MAG: hypothetical protein L3J66_12405 [Bacteroidales bacterium]|nr:hypothetical protein [Bacteroidales bacterium]
MKMKKMMIVLGLALGLITLMSSECNTSDPVEPACGGFASATSTGFIAQSFCFDVLVTYDFNGTEGFDFTARQEGDVEYAFSINLWGYNGPGTYDISPESHGFAELIIHGDESEFYKVTSGSLTVTEADATTMKGTFDIVTVGFYNGETVNITGTIDKK